MAAAGRPCCIAVVVPRTSEYSEIQVGERGLMIENTGFGRCIGKHRCTACQRGAACAGQGGAGADESEWPGRLASPENINLGAGLRPHLGAQRLECPAGVLGTCAAAALQKLTNIGSITWATMHCCPLRVLCSSLFACLEERRFDHRKVSGMAFPSHME